MGALDSTIVLLAFPSITDGLHSELHYYHLDNSNLSVGNCSYYNPAWTNRRHLWTNHRVQHWLWHFYCRLGVLRVFTKYLFLIGSRVVQALGGALMQSNSGAIIADTFPPNARGKAYGLARSDGQLAQCLALS